MIPTVWRNAIHKFIVTIGLIALIAVASGANVRINADNYPAETSLSMGPPQKSLN